MLKKITTGRHLGKMMTLVCFLMICLLIEASADVSGKSNENFLLVAPIFSRRVFNRDENTAIINWKITNQGNSQWQGTVSFDIEGFVLNKSEISLKPQSSMTLNTEFTPGIFSQGTYSLNVNFESQDGVKRPGKAPVKLTIGPWRYRDKFLLSAWPIKHEAPLNKYMHEAAGFNVLPFNTVADLDGLAAMGVYGGTHLRTYPHVRAKADMDKLRNELPCPVSEDYLAKCSRTANEFLAGFENHSAIRLVTVNTENFGALCFCHNCQERMKNEFKLDPEKLWSGVRKMNDSTRFGTLLIPHGSIPLTDIVDSNNPVLRYARWWWTEGGLNVGNQLIADKLHECQPDIRVKTEPLVRFASLRRYRSPMVVSCWSYPPDPRSWIATSAYLRSLAQSWECPLMITIGTVNLAGTYAPYHVTMPSDNFRMTHWLALSAFPTGLDYWFSQPMFSPDKYTVRNFYQPASRESLEKKLEGLSWKEACKKIKDEKLRRAWVYTPGLPETMRDIVERVIEPFGPLLLATKPRKADIAIYHSFSTRVMGFKNWWNQHSWIPMARKIIEGPYAVDILFEDQIEQMNLSDYKIIILPAIGAMPDKAVGLFKDYIRNGGTLICDRKWHTLFQGSVMVNALALDSDANTEVDDAILTFDAGLDSAGRKSQAGLWKAIGSRLKPDYQSSSSDVLIREGRADNTGIVMTVNTNLGKGPMFGKYPNALEKSMPISADVSIKGNDKPHAYDLLKSQKLTITAKDGYFHFHVDLPPAGGKIIAFYAQEIGEVKILAVKKSSPGAILKIKVELSDCSGNLFEGVVPIRFMLKTPDGKESDLSHYSCIKNGIWEFDWQVPVEIGGNSNSICGQWKIIIKELALGKSDEMAVSIEK